MFQLFQNIFGSGADTKGRYPESLVTMAIERALEGTDARMRLLPGYAKKLRLAVVHAIDHVVDMIDRLPSPVSATSAGYDASPELAAFFYSAARMTDILGKDQAWRAFREANAGYAGPAVALLLAAREEKHTFGYALVDDKPVSDVAQTVVAFNHPVLRDVCREEVDTRRLLRRRAFDYLLGIALARMEEKQSERSNLTQRRAVMRAKLSLLQKGSGFAQGDGENPAALQSKLEVVEQELKQLGADDTVLASNLAILSEVLSAAETYFWLTESTLHLVAQHVLHDKVDAGTTTVILRDLCDGQGHRASALLLALP